MTRVADRVQETTSTTGTGPITLNGAKTGFRSFSSALGPGLCRYAIVSQVAAEWEVVVGTLTVSPDALSRTTVEASSNGGALVNFTAGLKDVFSTISAAAVGGTIFSKEFISIAQTITLGSTLTLAHGLGVIPKLVQLRLKCTTTDQGWAVGDEIVVANTIDYGGGGAGTTASNFAVYVDATNVGVIIGAANLIHVNKSTRQIQNLTAGSWQLYARAWA